MERFHDLGESRARVLVPAVQEVQSVFERSYQRRNPRCSGSRPGGEA